MIKAALFNLNLNFSPLFFVTPLYASNRLPMII